MGKYFNQGGSNLYRHLRVVGTGGDESGDNGFSIMKGGLEVKGKLKQADVLIGGIDTREEAEELVKKLCEL